MARLNGFFGVTLDTVNGYLQAKAGYLVYVLRQGGNVASASAGVTLTLRAGDGARFANNDYIQLGADFSTVRRITAGGGTDSLTLSSAVSAIEGQRVLNCGTVAPVLVGSVQTYDPHSSANAVSKSTVYTEDTDAAVQVTASKIVSSASGQFFFFGADDQYDLLVQTSAGVNTYVIAGIALGSSTNQLLTDGSRPLTNSGGPQQIVDGVLASGVVDGATAVGFTLKTLNTFANAGAKLLRLMNGAVEYAYFTYLGWLVVDTNLTTKGLFYMGSLSNARPVINWSNSNTFLEYNRTSNYYSFVAQAQEKLRLAATPSPWALGNAGLILNGGSGSVGAPVKIQFGPLTNAAWEVFADLDTTPAVEFGNMFLASNSGATLITAFDRGQDTQRITVVATNGNTTIVNSANLVTRSGANIVMAANSSRAFVYRASGNVWYED